MAVPPASLCKEESPAGEISLHPSRGLQGEGPCMGNQSVSIRAPQAEVREGTSTHTGDQSRRSKSSRGRVQCIG